MEQLGLFYGKEQLNQRIDKNAEIEQFLRYNIVDVLDGEEVLRFNDFISGNILVASYRSTTFLNNISLNNDTILIVGDRHSILEYAVFSKVKMIIMILFVT